MLDFIKNCLGFCFDWPQPRQNILAVINALLRIFVAYDSPFDLVHQKHNIELGLFGDAEDGLEEIAVLVPIQLCLGKKGKGIDVVLVGKEGVGQGLAHINHIFGDQALRGFKAEPFNILQVGKTN